jgi:hypothetical protein
MKRNDNKIIPAKMLIYQIILLIPVGTWSQWSDYSECSQTCGTGRKTRSRICNGGLCSGNSQQTVHCNIQECITGYFYHLINQKTSSQKNQTYV